MTLAAVPDDGVRRAYGKRMAGRQLCAASGTPVAWLAERDHDGAGSMWADLAGRSAVSGLQPFLVAGTAAVPPGGEFRDQVGEPEDIGIVDEMDAEEVLRRWWPGSAVDNLPDDGELRERLEPFDARFPGLAPFIAEEPGPEFKRLALVQCTRYGKIGLVPAGRPADILPRIGWAGAAGRRTASELAVVLRSWEDRFGARLLEVGHSGIRLLVSRPPLTMEAAQSVAAEHVAFSDDVQLGLRRLCDVAQAIAGNAFWDFSWDRS